MAMKSGVPVYIFPVDQKRGKLTTEIPGGGELIITMRDVDVENVERLRKMDGVTVLAHPDEFKKVIENLD
jgi:flavoprotein